MIDRNYQVNAIHGVKNSIRNGHKRVLVQAATGSGKTHVAALIIEMAIAKGSKVLFVAHRKEIISQTSTKLASMGIKHGVIMAGTKPTDSPVQVASVQTLVRRDHWEKAMSRVRGREYEEGRQMQSGPLPMPQPTTRPSDAVIA